MTEGNPCGLAKAGLAKAPRRLRAVLDSSVLLPPGAEQPSAVDPDQYAGKAEPSQGVAEVIVWQGRMQASGPREAARRVGAFQFQIEGRDADALGGCDSVGVAGKPDVAGRIACGREYARRLRPTQHANHVDGTRNLAVRASLGILLAVRHEAPIDHHQGAVGEPRGRKYPVARA